MIKLEDSLKLILFGGKGGVGKTTLAGATSIYLSKNFKTLVFSTDPAHSLSDSLCEKIGDEIKSVKGVNNLSALEINAEKALLKFKLQYEDEIKKILDTSTYLDAGDINNLFELSIPGMDEVMGFKTIIDLIDEGKFDKYIVDTAPTGHALRLITLPDLLDDWIKVFSKMRWKYRQVVATFSGRYVSDKVDEFLVNMKKTVKRIESVLKNGNATEFVPVTIPEEMAIAETEKLVDSLNKYGISVKQLVVNNVLKSDNCEFCRLRRKSQEKYIKEINNKFSQLKIVVTPLFPDEIRGIDKLNEFIKELF